VQFFECLFLSFFREFDRRSERIALQRYRIDSVQSRKSWSSGLVDSRNGVVQPIPFVCFAFVPASQMTLVNRRSCVLIASLQCTGPINPIEDRLDHAGRPRVLDQITHKKQLHVHRLKQHRGNNRQATGQTNAAASPVCI
jgi:hypothetical protein